MLTNEIRSEILKPYEEDEARTFNVYEFARKYGKKSELNTAKIQLALATARLRAVEAALLEVATKTTTYKEALSVWQ